MPCADQIIHIQGNQNSISVGRKASFILFSDASQNLPHYQQTMVCLLNFLKNPQVFFQPQTNKLASLIPVQYICRMIIIILTKHCTHHFRLIANLTKIVPEIHSHTCKHINISFFILCSTICKDITTICNKKSALT